MADIAFYANILGAGSGADGTIIDHAGGDGLGFFGPAFGVSIPIAGHQDSTFVTDGAGSVEGSQLNNTKWESTTTCKSNTVTGRVLTVMPNYLCPLNVRFTHSETVMVQNCKLRIFDRADINNHASGVTTYVYESRHPSDQPTVGSLGMHGSSSSGGEWTVYDGVGSVTDMILTNSPGDKGTNTDTSDPSGDPGNLGYLTREGASHRSLRHDWYISASASPDSIGSKTDYGLYVSVEYL
jgi:hypothetical protein